MKIKEFQEKIADALNTVEEQGSEKLELDLLDDSVLTLLYKKGHGPLTLYKSKPPGAR